MEYLHNHHRCKERETVKETQIKKETRKIMNKYDPIHLLQMGCPKDEYNPEIQEIIKHKKKVKNSKEMHNLVYNTFVKMFDKKIAGPKKNCQHLSRELHRLIKKHEQERAKT